MSVEILAPFVDASLARVVEPGWVAAVPVDAMLEAHVEPGADDIRGPELYGEVERVKAAIPSPSDFAEFLE